jgi:hypothetical protein
MVRFFVCCVAILIGSGANAAEHIVGVVEVPALHNNLAGGPSGPVPLFAEPSMQSEVAVVVREWRHLEYRDVNAEAVAAVVYDYKVTSGVWFKVRYSDGHKSLYGWLSGANAGKFSWYFHIVRDTMTFFTAAWDKRLYQHPNVRAPSRQFPQFGEHTGVRVADSRGMGKDLWFLVVILEKSNCAFNDEGTTIIATGWVPAYADSGAETIWHYARGC